MNAGRKKVAVIASGVAGLVAMGAATAWAATDASGPQVLSAAASSPHSDPQMGSQLNSLVAKLGASDVTGPSLGQPIDGYGPGPFVVATVQGAGAENSQGQVGEFEASLLAADLAAVANGAAPGTSLNVGGQVLHDTVPGAKLRIVRADGTVRDTVTGGYVSSPGPYSDASDTEVGALVQSAAVANGFKVTSVRVLHLLDDAVVVTVELPKVPSHADLRQSLGGLMGVLAGPTASGPFEGVLVTVLAAGAPIAYVSAVPRAGMGTHWLSPAVTAAADPNRFSAPTPAP